MNETMVKGADAVTAENGVIIIFPEGVPAYAAKLGADLLQVDPEGEVFYIKAGSDTWVSIGEGADTPKASVSPLKPVK